ncbi:beta-crystallin A2 isoform X1 [Cebus imitator]|uniref:beta-crystallin A2 isoform X1 n=1 Tax=Cebus imitator TaxID=2715852 RepID=UPI001899F557|nr:beta-crystallin A2 isoform X1 [Cebus imitator]
MSSTPAPGSAPASLTLWDEEDFQGRRFRLLSDCANICERGGLRRVRSVKVENGVWVAFEYPDFQGQQFILEKGDYPRWSAWSGSSSHSSNQLLSFRPVLCANHNDSRVTLFEGDNFQGCKFDLSDDYPSLPSMGWASKDVGSLKVSSGATQATEATSMCWSGTSTAASSIPTVSSAHRPTPGSCSPSGESSTRLLGPRHLP